MHQGCYKSLVMHFDLCNALSTFSSSMNLIFKPYLGQFVIVFIANILYILSDIRGLYVCVPV